MTQPPNITHLSRDVRYAASSAPANHVPQPYVPRPYAPGEQPRKFVAKGHDAQLQEAQYGKLETVLTVMSGTAFTGLVVRRDKFTITLRHTVGASIGQDEIFYKHAIEGVLINRPALSN